MNTRLAVMQEIPDASVLWRNALRITPDPNDAEDVFQDMLIDSIKQDRYLKRTNRPRGVPAFHCRRRAVQRLFIDGEDCLDSRQRNSRANPPDNQESSQWIDDYFFSTTSSEADVNAGILMFVDELCAQLEPFEVEVLLCAWEWAQSDRRATCKSGGERVTADRQTTITMLARELRAKEYQVQVALCNVREVAQKLGFR